MTEFYWEQFGGQGETLLEAIENEFERDRDKDHTVLGRYMDKLWQEELEHYSEDSLAGEDYAEYVRSHGIEDIPTDKNQSPGCKHCGSKILNRYDWASRMMEGSETNYKDVLENFKDSSDEEIGKAFHVNPSPDYLLDTDGDDEQLPLLPWFKDLKEGDYLIANLVDSASSSRVFDIFGNAMAEDRYTIQLGTPGKETKYGTMNWSYCRVTNNRTQKSDTLAIHMMWLREPELITETEAMAILL